MSDSQVAEVKRGQRFVEVGTGIVFTATTDAHPQKNSTNSEVWLVSSGGAQVVRLSHSNAGHFKEVGS